MVTDQYGSLAADYHWFFDDVDLFLGCDTPGVRAAMAGLVSGARVLDAACGIGVDAAALLRRGFDVAASDASDEMAAAARQRLRSLGADGTSVINSAWMDLPDNFEAESFDAVFCIGAGAVRFAAVAVFTSRRITGAVAAGRRVDARVYNALLTI